MGIQMKAKRMALIFLTLCVAGWVVMLYFVVLLPKQVANWADEGRALAVPVMWIIDIGYKCQQFAGILFLMLSVFTVGSITWVVMEFKKKRNSINAGKK